MDLFQTTVIAGMTSLRRLCRGGGRETLLSMAALLAPLGAMMSSALADESWSEGAVIGADGPGFGADVAIEGNVLLVGAPTHLRDLHGQAFLYDADTGVLVTRLSVPNSGGFGGSVALTGTRAVVAAASETNGGADGAVYVIDIISEQILVRISSPPDMRTDRFGREVAAHDDAVAIGTSQPHASYQIFGEAYVYDLTTGAQLLKLQASDGLFDDHFGEEVAIDETYVAIGAPYGRTPNGADDGAVYCYRRSTGEELAKIPCPSDRAEYSGFGRSLSLKNGLLAAGDMYAWGGKYEAGVVYIFDLDKGRYRYRLVADPPMLEARIGESVATDGQRVLAGGTEGYSGGKQSGIAHVFSLADGEHIQMLEGSLTHDRAQFGSAAAIDGHRAVVSAVANEPISPDHWKGAVYVYRTTSPGLHVRERGLCPGALTISAANATPGGRVAFIYSRNPDFEFPSKGPCRGTMIGLGRPYVSPTPQIVVADADGEIQMVMQVDESDCGRLFLQAIDLENCEPSNVLSLQ